MFFEFTNLLKDAEVVFSKFFRVCKDKFIAIDSLKVMRCRVERLARLDLLGLRFAKQDDLSILNELC